MKHPLILIIALMVGVVGAYAQHNPTPRSQQEGKSTGRTSGTAHRQGNTNAAESENDNELLGNDNRKARSPRSSGNSSADYRNNRVIGNPNNSSSGDGGRRSTAAGVTEERSTADDTLNSRSTDSGPSMESMPVTDGTTSSSGTPAILSGGNGRERDGTNTVQRATPNMAGSPVRGLRMGRRTVDPDREARGGVVRQQREAVGNDVSRARRKTQAHPATNQATVAEDSIVNTAAKSNASTIAPGRDNEKKETRKERRKKRRSRG